MFHVYFLQMGFIDDHAMVFILRRREIETDISVTSTAESSYFPPCSPRVKQASFYFRQKNWDKYLIYLPFFNFFFSITTTGLPHKDSDLRTTEFRASVILSPSLCKAGEEEPQCTLVHYSFTKIPRCL